MNKVWLLLTDLHGIVRGKLVPVSHRRLAELKTEFSGVFANDIFDRPIPELKQAEESVNITAVPYSEGIPSPWDNSEVYFMCNAFLDDDECIPSVLCPRTLLSNAMKEAEKEGYRMKCGMELEWSLLKEGEPVLGSLQTYSMLHYENSKFQEFLSELIDKTKSFPVTIEALHAESGKSIFEAALSPADALKVADSTQLFRMTIRRLANVHGMSATFMSKLFADTAGCGAHIHMSLNNLDGSKAKDVLFSSFLAGLLYHMDTSLVLLLPNANSYKRLNTGEFWTTNHVSFGIDNRSNAIRLVHHLSTAGDARIELRIPGGDVNPYLALYYCLKAGMWGIKHQIKLDDIGKPGENIKRLSRTLREASMLFMEEKSPSRELYGDTFVDHYGHQRVHEATLSEALPRPENWEKGVF